MIVNKLKKTRLERLSSSLQFFIIDNLIAISLFDNSLSKEEIFNKLSLQSSIVDKIILDITRGIINCTYGVRTIANAIRDKSQEVKFATIYIEYRSIPLIGVY